MIDNGTQKRHSIRSELKSIETRNASATNREELRQQMEHVKNAIESIADPVLKSEYQRQLTVLRGRN